MLNCCSVKGKWNRGIGRRAHLTPCQSTIIVRSQVRLMIKFNAKVRSRESWTEHPSEPHFLWTSADNGGKGSPLQLGPFSHVHTRPLIHHLLHITRCNPLMHTVTKEKVWQDQGHYFSSKSIVWCGAVTNRYPVTWTLHIIVIVTFGGSLEVVEQRSVIGKKKNVSFIYEIF